MTHFASTGHIFYNVIYSCNGKAVEQKVRNNAFIHKFGIICIQFAFKLSKRQADQNVSVGLCVSRLLDTHHKGESPGWEGSVVSQAVSHAHLHLGFLNAVSCGVIQQTHNPAEEKNIGILFCD